MLTCGIACGCRRSAIGLGRKLLQPRGRCRRKATDLAESWCKHVGGCRRATALSSPAAARVPQCQTHSLMSADGARNVKWRSSAANGAAGSVFNEARYVWQPCDC